jgi:uncharacterized protein YjiS (DUF1127 family)
VTAMFATFSDIRRHSAYDSINAAVQALGRSLLRISARLQRWAQRRDERRQLATLGLRLLDDVGLTPAERDAMLR